jgi:transposase-like protein
MNTCPNCGFESEDLEKCPECGFNFNYLLDCPYKISDKCIHTNKDCYIEGLNFELCEIYLHKAGIHR